jgi:hypothetical protein
MFYLPAQATAGPHASFFHVFDGEKRKAINPYQWIDKTIINHQPEPEPVPDNANSIPAPPVRKDPKLTRALLLIEGEKQKHNRANYEEQVDAAIQRWHEHPKGSGNQAFFELAVALAGAGMERFEIKNRLHAEAEHAHGSQSRRDRRAAIPHIMSKLRCAA